MVKEEFLRRIKFIVQFGKALHSVGAPAHTLEAALSGLSEKLGLKGSFVSIPTAIFFSFRFLDEEVTRIVRVKPSGTDLGLMAKVYAVAQDVIQGTIAFDDGSQHLEEALQTHVPYRPLLTLLCVVLTSAGMLCLFGGTWGDFFAAGVVGLIMGLLGLSRSMGRVGELYEAIVAMVGTLVAYLIGQLSPNINEAIVILSGLIVLMPGMNITISLAEIATQNLTSGTSRLMGGVMILLKLTFGVFIGTKLASVVHMGELDWTFTSIPTWFQFIAVPVTAACSVVIYKAEKEDTKWVTMAGIFGYVCAKLGTFWAGPEVGMFVGGLCVGAGSNVFSRTIGRPSSIFQFPGLILIVPGSVGYRGLSYFYQRDMMVGFDTAFTMVALAFSLVVGVFVGNILVRPRLQF